MPTDGTVPDRAKGIDLSDWDVPKSWDAIWNAGITFIGYKATEGDNWTGHSFKTAQQEIRKLPFSLAIYYHFARQGDPKKQAERLLDVCGTLRDNERLCLDLEGNTPTPDDPTKTLAWVTAFYTQLTSGVCSRKPLLYTSDRIWRLMGNSDWDLASEIDLWLPRYSTQEPVVPKPWKAIGKNWTFWQFADGTSPEHIECPGVGPCDHNWFNGTQADLDAYAKLTK